MLVYLQCRKQIRESYDYKEVIERALRHIAIIYYVSEVYRQEVETTRYIREALKQWGLHAGI